MKTNRKSTDSERQRKRGGKLIKESNKRYGGQQDNMRKKERWVVSRSLIQRNREAARSSAVIYVFGPVDTLCRGLKNKIKSDHDYQHGTYSVKNNKHLSDNLVLH